MSTKSNRTTRRPTAKPASRSAAKGRPPAKPNGSKRSQLIAMLRTPAGGTIEPGFEYDGKV